MNFWDSFTKAYGPAQQQSAAYALKTLATKKGEEREDLLYKQKLQDKIASSQLTSDDPEVIQEGVNQMVDRELMTPEQGQAYVERAQVPIAAQEMFLGEQQQPLQDLTGNQLTTAEVQEGVGRRMDAEDYRAEQAEARKMLQARPGDPMVSPHPTIPAVEVARDLLRFGSRGRSKSQREADAAALKKVADLHVINQDFWDDPQNQNIPPDKLQHYESLYPGFTDAYNAAEQDRAEQDITAFFGQQGIDENDPNYAEMLNTLASTTPMQLRAASELAEMDPSNPRVSAGQVRAVEAAQTLNRRSSGEPVDLLGEVSGRYDKYSPEVQYKARMIADQKQQSLDVVERKRKEDQDFKVWQLAVENAPPHIRNAMIAQRMGVSGRALLAHFDEAPLPNEENSYTDPWGVQTYRIPGSKYDGRNVQEVMTNVIKMTPKQMEVYNSQVTSGRRSIQSNPDLKLWQDRRELYASIKRLIAPMLNMKPDEYLEYSKSENGIRQIGAMNRYIRLVDEGVTRAEDLRMMAAASGLWDRIFLNWEKAFVGAVVPQVVMKGIMSASEDIFNSSHQLAVEALKGEMMLIDPQFTMSEAREALEQYGQNLIAKPDVSWKNPLTVEEEIRYSELKEIAKKHPLSKLVDADWDEYADIYEKKFGIRPEPDKEEK